MTKLKLSAIPDDKPVKLTVALPADVHRDLVDYATVLARQTGQKSEPAQLVAPMIARFMATGRGFATARRTHGRQSGAEKAALQNKPSQD
ncbi:DUF2274 domain-containing protein [Rhodobacteraceae bacterium N5(2021)]|uniref:DUF2274 domain-containing protein n=1 Tax=Gymnodinialimonas phycosphaerae TaxID=2841589 RepID=A0A975TS90_9RHOB|nr:DUF2274 domain-containing protein [Gymnodinialimonas phycosphaerae]MBY4893488.1 DUF2274 domain-containing protein [Gymnodinialimonas phycosphaerae]